MSIKIIFDNKKDIPEHLQSQAEEIDGKYQLDGGGVINKNKELVKDNSTLRAKNEELVADKEAAEAQAAEWKGKAKIPSGQKLVAADIAELGEIAKTAELSKDDLTTLKTDVDAYKAFGTPDEVKAKVESHDDLKAQVESDAIDKTIDAVAQASGYNARFKKLAKEKGLKFEKGTEKVDGKDEEVWSVVGENDKKTKVADFVVADEYFKDFAETFVDSQQQTRRYAAQLPDNKKSNPNKYDAIRESKQAEQKPANFSSSLTERFYNRPPQQAGAD